MRHLIIAALLLTSAACATTQAPMAARQTPVLGDYAMGGVDLTTGLQRPADDGRAYRFAQVK